MVTLSKMMTHSPSSGDMPFQSPAPYLKIAGIAVGSNPLPSPWWSWPYRAVYGQDSPEYGFVCAGVRVCGVAAHLSAFRQNSGSCPTKLAAATASGMVINRITSTVHPQMCTG